MTDLVRPLLAALINDDLRLVLAEALAEGLEPLSPAKRARARQKLIDTGVVTADGDALTFDPGQARKALQAMARPRREGLDRFLTDTGRVDRYPSDHETRVEFLTTLAKRALQPGERMTEPVLTVRLEGLADDAVLLRRHLIDYGVAERTPGGEEYWLAEA